MKESGLWAGVKVGLSPFAHMSRIENTAGSGICDVNACSKGVEAWIELKMFKGRRLHFRNSQLNWILSRAKQGGNVFVLARKDGDMLLWRADELLTNSVRKPEGDKTFSLEPDIAKAAWWGHKPFKWSDLARAIFQPRIGIIDVPSTSPLDIMEKQPKESTTHG